MDEAREKAVSSSRYVAIVVRTSMVLLLFFLGGIIPAYAQAPSITSLSLTSGPGPSESGDKGMAFDIIGSNFGTAKGNSTAMIGTTALTIVKWTATEIEVQLPSGAATGSVTVTVDGAGSNTKNFTVETYSAVCS
jgi:hypothetical protein